MNTRMDIAAVTPKSFRDGTERTTAPERTLERLGPLLRPMGITRIANVTGLDTVGIPVTMVTRPNSRSLAVAQGKGITLTAAKVSGVMESIETYHAEHIERPLLLGSYEDLAPSHTIASVEELPRVAGNRYWPHHRMLWIEGWDIMQHRPTLVPYEAVHCNYTLPHVTGHGAFAATTNGLASGNHPLEAISHGICEVIERDATTLWELGGAERLPQVDHATIDDPACQHLIERFEHAGLSVAIWSTTSDVAVACFLCMVVPHPNSTGSTWFAAQGMGCHPRRAIALQRALTEAAQSRLTQIAGSRDDITLRDLERMGRDSNRQAIELALATGASTSFGSVADWDSDTFNDDVARELQCLQATGIQSVVVVDLSIERFGIPVVRVVIPGLENSDIGRNQHGEYRQGKRAGAAAQRTRPA